MLVEAAAGAPRGAGARTPGAHPHATPDAHAPQDTSEATISRQDHQLTQAPDNTHDHGSHGNTHITMQNGGPRRLSLRGPPQRSVSEPHGVRHE